MPSDLWELEPRDEAFALPRERFFRERFVELLHQLVPGASLDNVECRRGTCELQLSAAANDAKQLDGALGFIPFGDVFVNETLGTDGVRVNVLVHVSVTREHMDQAIFDSWFEKWWADRERLARERYDRDHASGAGAADGGVL